MQKQFKKDFGVYCCPHIFKSKKIVLLVVRDSDGDFQFLCGDEHEEYDDCHLVCINHILDKDPSLGDMVNLEPLMGAERKSIQSEWNYFELEK